MSKDERLSNGHTSLVWAKRRYQVKSNWRSSSGNLVGSQSNATKLAAWCAIVYDLSMLRYLLFLIYWGCSIRMFLDR
jgi:hypothetical protein